MAKYVEVKKTKDFANTFLNDIFLRMAANRVLDAAPAADVAEVVHGRWIDTETGTLCSNCHRCFDPDFEIKRSVCRELKHCPDCGADMRERRTDD